MDKQTPDWKKLEVLIAEIQKQLAPGATVSHNVMLEGHESETKRQIDVLVQQSIGPHSMTIVIDCKDYKTPVDVKGVEEFIGLVDDVKADKGAMVCPAGFTSSAKKKAKKNRIDLFSPADTDPHKWQVKLMMPTLCDFRSARFGFAISCNYGGPLTIPEKFYEMQVFDAHHAPLGTCLEYATRFWEEGDYPDEIGVFEAKLFDGRPTLIDNGHGGMAPVDLTTRVQVKQQLYIGQLPIKSLKGLRDEHTGAIVTNAFKLAMVDPVEIQNEWEKVEDETALPYQVGMRMTGLLGLGPKQ
jgi:hypothetical protein